MELLPDRFGRRQRRLGWQWSSSMPPLTQLSSGEPKHLYHISIMTQQSTFIAFTYCQSNRWCEHPAQPNHVENSPSCFFNQHNAYWCHNNVYHADRNISDSSKKQSLMKCHRQNSWRLHSEQNRDDPMMERLFADAEDVSTNYFSVNVAPFLFFHL